MKKKLSSALPCYSFLSTLVGSMVFSGSVVFSGVVVAGELADLPYEAGNWTPPKVYILLDNSESMRSETVIPPGSELSFPMPGVREGLVTQWDQLYFSRFVDPSGARIKFINGVPLPGMHTVNIAGTSVLSPNTQCNIIDPTKNTLYFDSRITDKPYGYLPWTWWDYSNRYAATFSASITEIPSWFRYGSCGSIKQLSDLPPTVSGWPRTSLSQQDVANWWKFHSTRSKIVQAALSDVMDDLRRDMIFGIRELNGPNFSDMQLNLGTDLAPDNTVGAATTATSIPLWVIPPSEAAVTIPASAGLDFDVNIPGPNYHTGSGANEHFDQNLIEQRNVAIVASLLQREDLGPKLSSDGITRIRPKHNVGRTPLRSGLHAIGRYFEGGGAALDNACQRTFALVVTDGYWNESYGAGIPAVDPSDPITGDQDGDSYSVSFSDIAAYFYNTGFGANGLVANDWNAKTRQHLSTYVVSMGLQGNLPVPVSTPPTGGCVGDWPTAVGAVNPLPLPPDASGMAANWGNPQTDKVGIKHISVGDAERVDDMWHAAYNARGRFVNTNDAHDLASRIYYSFKDMHAQSQSFENRNIISGIELNMESSPKMLYVASFNPSSWSGSVTGYNLKDDGSIDGVAFPNVTGFAEDTGHTGKEGNIFTFNTSAKAPVDFEYGSIGGEEQSDLFYTEAERLRTSSNPSCARPPASGDLLVDFLKGDKTHEGKPPYNFRERKSVIGDVVHSKPVFVGKPNKYYKDKWANESARENVNQYSDFVETVGTRLPMLYVGANDGYLHGFKGVNGERWLSYMPSFLMKDIGLLADADYVHQYFMDGQMAVDDVCLPLSGDGCEWITMLVGSAGAGGQGLFALDITKPGYMNASKVLWEFTDLNNNGTASPPHEADLGFVMGAPNIGRFRKKGSGSTGAKDSGQWLVAFSGGYHNTMDNLKPKRYRTPDLAWYTDPASTKSATGQAYLYLLNAKDGKIVKKVGVPGGTVAAPNGLGTPALLDADSDHIIDYIYVGDLLGRLWKIDVRNENPNEWTSLSTTLSGTTTMLSASDALFTAPGNQPITAAPVAVFHPQHLFESRRDSAGKIIRGTIARPDPHKLLLYFGTGKFFEKGDSIPQNQTTAQAFYAIYDDGTNQQLTRTNLKARSKTSYSVAPVAGADNGDTDFILGTAGTPPNRLYGWYLPLSNTNGERIVVDADYRATKDRSGSVILSDSKIMFNIMVPNSGGSCRSIDPNTVDGFAMILDPFTGNNAYYDSSSSVAKGGFRLTRSAAFANIRTQGFNGGDRFFAETKEADGSSKMNAVSVGSSVRHHRESFLQLTQ